MTQQWTHSHIAIPRASLAELEFDRRSHRAALVEDLMLFGLREGFLLPREFTAFHLQFALHVEHVQSLFFQLPLALLHVRNPLLQLSFELLTTGL